MIDQSGYPSRPAPPTGSATTDAEHGIQLGLLDATLSALASDAPDAGELLDQLHAYSEAHFLSEQLLMRMAARANYEGHVDQHTVLMQDLEKARTELNEEQYEAARTTLEDHHARLLAHIQSWDQSVEDPPGA
jgi:hemerythrin